MIARPVFRIRYVIRASAISLFAPLLAQEGGGGGGGGSLLGMLPSMAVILLLFYLLMLRPQRREQALRKAMLANLKKNDHVLTHSGIYGVVTNVRPEADEVTIKVDENSNTRLRMQLSAIARVVSQEPADEKAASKPD
jgi:preprotein translocase subunit YajC